MNAEMKAGAEADAKEDIELQQDVLDELDWEPSVDALTSAYRREWGGDADGARPQLYRQARR